MARGPSQARNRGRRAEQAERGEHEDDQAGFLDDLACVLQIVDEEAEDDSGHDREQRFIEELRKRPQPQERARVVHQPD